ncbi:hypothetical protein FQR65_LT02663 [Abscondita terminalis]|nr:hypothetical protein FQR65_LT02663 [Abscondita terminalis]
MNGPVKMYKTCQIIQHDLKVELPVCMYRMKNIHANKSDDGPLGDHVSSFRDSADISKQVKQFLKSFRSSPEMSTLIDRQQRILQQLDDLRQQMLKLKNDLCTPNIVESTVTATTKPPQIPNIVLNVSPEHPPYSLLVVKKLCSKSFNIAVSNHLHSTISQLPEISVQFIKDLESFPINQSLPTYTLRLIWKMVEPSLELLVSQVPIIGEPNMLRFLARLMPDLLRYETEKDVFEIDSTLDLCYSLVRAKSKTERLGLIQSLNKKLGKSQFLCGHSEMTIADVAASSAIKQVALNEITQNMTKWLQRCDDMQKWETCKRVGESVVNQKVIVEVKKYIVIVIDNSPLLVMSELIIETALKRKRTYLLYIVMNVKQSVIFCSDGPSSGVTFGFVVAVIDI